MTVLITGAGGFVGNWMGSVTFADAVGIERDSGKAVWWTYPVVAHGDLRDAGFVNRVVLEYQPDVVVHLAANAIVNHALENPIETYESNVIGTLTLLEACKKLKKALYFLYFSTDKVLGDVAGANEDAPYGGENGWAGMGPYEQSKAMSEVLASRYSKFFDVCITRSGNIYGPGDRSDRLIPNDIRRALEGKNPLAYNEDRRQYVYIGDAARAVKSLVDTRSTGIWHIGSPDVKTTVEVAQAIADNFSGLIVDRATDQAAAAHKYLYYIHNQYLDYSKLREKLGWLPQTTFEEGIGLTVKWWREHR